MLGRNSYEYDVFGAVRSYTGSTANAFTFTGEQTDATTGLEYLRARYEACPEHGRRDSATGRFLSLDPKGGRYRYAGNNPVNMVDPRGLYVICGYNEEWAGDICFDSTEVGLPEEVPTYCDIANNSCVWEETGFVAPYEDHHDAVAQAGGTGSCTNCDAQGSSGGGGGQGCGLLGIGCSSWAGPVATTLDVVSAGFSFGAAAITDLATAGGCAAGGLPGCVLGYGAGQWATQGLQGVSNAASVASTSITCAQDPGSADCVYATWSTGVGIASPEPNIDFLIDLHVLCHDLGGPCGP